MKGRGRKSAERCGKRFGSNGAGFGECVAAELLGQKRCTGDSGGAAAAQEAGFSDTAVLDASGQLEDVATDWIADFNRRCCTGQLTSVARIAKVVENSFAEHGRSMAKGMETAQRDKNQKKRI